MKVRLLKTFFTLLLICIYQAVSAQAGESCANPKIINKIPYTETNASSCSYPGPGESNYCSSTSSQTDGLEIYYRFTPTTSFCYSLTVTNWQVRQNGNDTFYGLYVNISEGCPMTGDCILSETIDSAPLNNLYFEAGKTYYIVFDHADTYNNCIIDLDFTLDKCDIPPCSNAEEAADDCENATPICDLNGYCGSTQEYHNSIMNGIDHCGSVENNTWLKFIASATTVELNAYAYNCTKNDGIQMWVGTSNNACAWSDIDAQGVACEGGPGFGIEFNTFTINGLAVGETYYLMIDGYGGDNCNYTIEAISGVTPLVDAGEDIYTCTNEDAIQLNGSSFATSDWTWETLGTGTFDNINILNPKYTPSALDVENQRVSLVLSHPGAGICQAFANDTMHIIFGAYLGEDQNICGNKTTLTATPSGGTWSSTSSEITIKNPNNSSTSVTLTNNAYGTYTVTYTYPSSGNCTVITNDIDISFYQKPEGTAGADSLYCDAGTYQLNGSVTVGTGQWTSGMGISDSNNLRTDIIINNTGKHQYELTITNSTCTPLVDLVNITIEEKPIINLPDTFYFCELTNEISGHSPVGNITWRSLHPEIFFNDINIPNPIITSSKHGLFKVYLDDKNGSCPVITDSSLVYMIHPPVADFTWFPEELSIDNSAVSFNNHSTESDEFTWFFGSYGTSQNKHPSFEFILEDSLEVEVCLEAIGFCVDTICKQLSFTGKTLIYIPNSFTPNGDGKNDLFQPILIGEDITAYNFSIFDTWGERIFHSTNPDDAWNGTYKGSKVQVGVYSYLVTIKERYSPKREEYMGHVRVLR